MVVIQLKRYKMVDTESGQVLFEFSAEPAKVTQFERDLDDTFTTDRYELREASEGCIHDWQGVGVIYGELPRALTFIEQCTHCKEYRKVNPDDVSWFDTLCEGGADE